MNPSHVEDLLGLIEQRRQDDVVQLIRSTVRDDGFDEAVRILAAAQVVTGLRWQTQEWSVAAEHAATAIVDLALTAAALEVEPTPPPPLGTIVVACAEEEWHVLPPRILVEQLRAGGWDAIFLGASTPAGHLADFLAAIRPSAVAISCSVPLFLPGAARSIAACHAAGVPVVAGGAGFGRTSRRAAALGADAWATTAVQASSIIACWLESPPVLACPVVDDRPQLALSAERPEIIEAAVSALATSALPVGTNSRHQLETTREALDHTVRSVEAALRTDDDSIVAEFAVWLSSVLMSRDLPHETVPIAMRTLRDCVPATFPDARRLLEVGADATVAAD